MALFLTVKEFFKKISKKVLSKRVGLFLLLFFVITAMIIPYTAFAKDWLHVISFGTLAWPNKTELKAAYGNAAKSLGITANPFFNAIISAVGLVLIIPSSFLAAMASEILLYVMDPKFFDFSMTGFDNPVIQAGWPIMRDLGNMIIVLGFILIGIATTLRFKDYEAKKLLIPLIGVALLINFSLVICGVIIDGSNIVTSYFLKNGGFTQKSMMDVITEQTKNVVASAGQADDPTTNLGNVVGITFTNLMMFLIFMMFAFLFLVRYIALWFLVMVSPLAFVFYVFPYTKRFFTMWWNNFLNWCIIGIAGSFFIYLSDKLSSNLLTPKPGVKPPNSIMAALIPGITLVVGFLFSLSAGAMGAGMVTGRFGNMFNKAKGALGKAAGGLAKGTAGKPLSMLGNIASRQPLVRNVMEASRRGRARLAEATGWAKEGTYARKEDEIKAEARKTISALKTSSRPADRRKYEELVRSGRGALGATAVETANKENDLARIMGGDINAINGRVNFAVANGQERSDFEDKNYQLAQFNQTRVNQALRANGINPETATDAQRRDAGHQANLRKLGELLPSMKPNALRAINQEDVAGAANWDFVRENFTPRMMEQIQIAENDDLRAAMRDHAAPLGRIDAAIAAATTPQEINRLEKLRDAMRAIP